LEEAGQRTRTFQKEKYKNEKIKKKKINDCASLKKETDATPSYEVFKKSLSRQCVLKS